MKTLRIDQLGFRRVFICLAALTVLAAACSETDRSAGTERSPAVAVEVVPVETADLKETVDAVGSLTAIEAVTIRPEISQILQTIHFSEGDPVKKGDRLFSLDDEEIQQRLTARRAALAAAEAQVENDRKMMQRRRQLLDDGTIAPETFDEVKTRYEAAVARRNRLEAEIGEIAARLQNTEIRSPIDGVAGDIRVDVGDFVEKGDPLVTVVRSDVLEIEFSVPERYAGRVRKGQAVSVQTAAYPDQSFEGNVFFISPSIRESTRDLLLKARIDNSRGMLRPGGFADVELVLEVRRQALVLPEEALVPTRTGYDVFVVEDRHARQRDVTIGLRKPGIVEIREGLEAGQTVVRSGHISLADGDRVQVTGDDKPGQNVPAE